MHFSNNPADFKKLPYAKKSSKLSLGEHFSNIGLKT